MNKVLPSADAAVALIPDGATILMGGFGLCGIPENLIKALHARNGVSVEAGSVSFSPFAAQSFLPRSAFVLSDGSR